MSSILEALKKLESAEGETRRLTSIPAPRPPRVGLVAAGLLAGFATGGGLALWVLHNRPRASVAAPEVVPPMAAAPATPPPTLSTPEPSVPSAPATGVVPVAPAVADALPLAPPVPQPSRPAEPPRRRTTATEPQVAAVAPEPVLAPPPRPSEGNAATRPPAGAPRIQVSFLAYSATPARRTVALSIDGGTIVTLHEGEHAEGITVARILPDRVELRHEDDLFTVRVRD